MHEPTVSNCPMSTAWLTTFSPVATRVLLATTAAAENLRPLEV